MFILINTVLLPSLNANCSSLKLLMKGIVSDGMLVRQRVSPAVTLRAVLARLCSPQLQTAL